MKVTWTSRATLTTMLVLQATALCLSGEPDDLRLLRAENRLLRAQLRSLQKQVAMLRTQVDRLSVENAKLKTRLKTGIQPTSRPAQTTPTARKYSYRGRSISSEWFERQYRRFADKIVLLGGKFYDAGEAVVLQSAIWTNPPPVGALRWPIAGSHFRKAKIFQSLGGGEAIVELTISGVGVASRTVLFHVKGIDASMNVDDAAFPDVPLVYAGTYNYVTVLGASKTIQSYRPYRPLTRAQFRQALAAGFHLVEHKKIKKRSGVQIVSSPVP